MKPGDIAPNFILKDETGKDFELYKNLDQTNSTCILSQR